MLKNLFVTVTCGLLALTARKSTRPQSSPPRKPRRAKRNTRMTATTATPISSPDALAIQSELPAVSSLDAGAQKMIQANGGNVPALAGPRFMTRWGGKTTKDLSARIMEAAGLDDEQRYLNITA